jgi:hypothetical protein
MIDCLGQSFGKTTSLRLALFNMDANIDRLLHPAC